MPPLERAVRWTLLHQVTVFVLVVMVGVVGRHRDAPPPARAPAAGLEKQPRERRHPGRRAANPIEVQETIIRPTEELLRTIPGIKKLESRASPNRARI